MSLFQLGGRVFSKNHLKFVTFVLGRLGVKGNSDNVTEYDVFFSPKIGRNWEAKYIKKMAKKLFVEDLIMPVY